MSKRTYCVSYWVEQGYFTYVDAHSPAQAERIVECQLDDENDPLPGSERVHHDHGVCSVSTRRVKRPSRLLPKTSVMTEDNTEP